MKKTCYILFAIFIFGTQLYSQQEETDVIKWNDGKKNHRLRVVSDSVIEFDRGSSDEGSDVKKSDKAARVVKRGSRYKLWKVSKKQIVKSLKKTAVQSTGSYSQCSPVFINRSGQRVALPGNIIIRFSTNWTAEMVSDWAAKKELTVIRKLSHHYNSYLIKTPAGMKTLEIVNSIAQENEIESVKPNWWVEVSLR